MFYMFLLMTISLLSMPQTLSSQSVDLIGSIQTPQAETVVLVSNNILGGEVFSNSNEETTNYVGSVLATSFLLQGCGLYNNKFLLKESFIHNLSTNKQKVHQIRAP